MPFFNQDIFVFCAALAQGPNTPQPLFNGMTSNEALQIDHDAGVNGIDQALRQFNLDAIVSFTDNPAWETDLLYSDTGRFYFASSGLAAAPGYPIIQVPATMVLQTPMGVSFLGTAFSEPTLIKLASGFEAFTEYAHITCRSSSITRHRITSKGRHRGRTRPTRRTPRHRCRTPTRSIRPRLGKSHTACKRRGSESGRANCSARSCEMAAA